MAAERKRIAAFTKYAKNFLAACRRQKMLIGVIESTTNSDRQKRAESTGEKIAADRQQAEAACGNEGDKRHKTCAERPCTI